MPVELAHGDRSRGARDDGGLRERSRSAGDGPRMALVAGSVAAVAVLGVATGLAARSGDRLSVMVAAAVLLAAAGMALLAVRRGYSQPAARSARILAEMAASNGELDQPLEAAAAAARTRISSLEHARQRLSAVIGALPQGVLVFGGDGTLLEINRTGAGMLGAAAGTDGASADGAAMTLSSELLQRHGVARWRSRPCTTASAPRPTAGFPARKRAGCRPRVSRSAALTASAARWWCCTT